MVLGVLIILSLNSNILKQASAYRSASLLLFQAVHMNCSSKK
jgi:hypothetical protein